MSLLLNAAVLFLLFINDIVTDIKAGIKLFADDTSLYATVDILVIRLFRPMSLLILLLNTFDYIMGKQFVIYIGNILFIVKVNLCFFGNVATLLRIVFR
jgi:hypothetical protein